MATLSNTPNNKKSWITISWLMYRNGNGLRYIEVSAILVCGFKYKFVRFRWKGQAKHPFKWWLWFSLWHGYTIVFHHSGEEQKHLHSGQRVTQTHSPSWNEQKEEINPFLIYYFNTNRTIILRPVTKLTDRERHESLLPSCQFSAWVEEPFRVEGVGILPIPFVMV